MSFFRKALACIAILSIASTAQAGFFNFGLANNDGTNLTVSATSAQYTLDLDPTIPGHAAPRGFGSTYFGAGLTHEGDPSVLWNGNPTDVGIVITNIMHDGHQVASGFSVGSGELGGFDDVFVNQVPPTNRVGLNTPAQFLTHDMLHEAQTGDPMDPAYENHAHIYFEAEQQGVWDVTFVLRDLDGSPSFGDSDPFAVQFVAVPEPTAAASMLLAMVWWRGRWRRK